MSSHSSDTVIIADQEKTHPKGGGNTWEKDPERQQSVPPDSAIQPSTNRDGMTTPASQDTAPSPDDDGYEVTLDLGDDPKNISTGRKWLITLVICNASLCATFASSVVCQPSTLYGRVVVYSDVSITGIIHGDWIAA